jgi:circadian clock protein KaiC
MHLTALHKQVNDFEPRVVIVDPLTSLLGAGTNLEAESMLMRLIDYLKGRQITGIFTSLTHGGEALEKSQVGISSLIDTWLMLEVTRSGGERNRVINVIKSRGMAHSNQTSEYQLTRNGLQILDTYLGASGVLTGSARLAKEAEDAAKVALREDEIGRKQALRESRRRALDARLTALREEFAAEDTELERAIKEEEILQRRVESDRTAMGRSRRAFAAKSGGGTKNRGKDGQS